MTLISFDGIAAEYFCETCAPAPQFRDPAKVRQMRRTAGGTMPALSPTVYAEVRASGPCVYCGAETKAADHVNPLARGGLDVRENLVPACRGCNGSKGDRLLTEWNPEKVRRAAAVSPIIAAELVRLQVVSASPSS